MKKIALLILLLIMPVPLFAGGLEFSGYLKNETALGLNTNQIQKFKNIFQISGEKKFNDNWAMFVSGRYWYDFAYSWIDRFDRAQHYMQHVQRNNWVRDFYLDYTSEKLDVRLGKQQVAWGQANGIAVLDRVNPFDLTEFWFQDFVDMRIPLWMANIKYSPKVDSNLQFLFMPNFEESTSAPPAAPFVFRSRSLFDEFKRQWDTNNNPVITIPAFLRLPLRVNTYYPAMKLKNSRFGLQWQDMIHGWQYTFNYLYGYDPLAYTYKEGTYNVGPSVGLIFSRRFKIIQMVGSSLNHTFTEKGPLEGLTVRGDAAVYIGEPTYYGDIDAGDAKAVNRWDNILWLIGLDKIVFTRWLVSFQFAQYVMAHEKPGGGQEAVAWQTMDPYTYGAQDRFTNIFTLKIATNTGFMHDRLKPEINFNYSGDNQQRINPKIVYQVRDNLWCTLGADYFYGRPDGDFGQYTKSKRAYVEMKYTF